MTLIAQPRTDVNNPIHIGIIGLSCKPDAWATLAHLPYLRVSPYYKIVALCNSSVPAAKASIKAHALPPSTRAYDSPVRLAQDADVDLVVVCTRVDTHFAMAQPALAAGKDVFIEWPLAATTAQARELLALAQAKQVRTLIGLQGRASPTILKIKAIVDSGRLGPIHSINVRAVSGVWQGNISSKRYEHFLNKEVGGNLLTIYGGHILDSVFAALGELQPGSYSTLLGNLRPQMQIVDDASNPVNSATETRLKSTPDQILLQGRLARSPAAVFSLHIRAGKRFAGTPGLTWRIYGDVAELVVEFESASLQIGQCSSMRICDLMSMTGVEPKVEEVDVEQGGRQWTDLPVQAQNIGRVYEAFAEEGRGEGWGMAVRRHELIDEFYGRDGDPKEPT